MDITDVRGNALTVRKSDYYDGTVGRLSVVALYPSGRLQKRVRERYVVQGAPPGSRAELLLLRKDLESREGRDHLEHQVYRLSVWRTTMAECCPWCVYCGKPLVRGTITADHWWPSVKGGPNSPFNWVPACDKCNSDKKETVIAKRMPKHSPGWMRANLALVLHRMKGPSWVDSRLDSFNVDLINLNWLRTKRLYNQHAIVGNDLS